MKEKDNTQKDTSGLPDRPRASFTQAVKGLPDRIKGGVGDYLDRRAERLAENDIIFAESTIDFWA